MPFENEHIERAVSELAIAGTLRVGINLGNSLLVTGTAPSGEPQGVAPDMAAAIAASLGVGVSYVTYPTPGEVADAGARDEWDIGLIAAEPKRAEKITFSNPYVEIEATYLLPAGSPFQSFEDVDQPGVRIAVMNRAAYDLYLTRTLKHAELVRSTPAIGANELFVTEKLDALAGLVPGLTKTAVEIPGSRVMPGCYTAVQQAIGAKPSCTNLQDLLQAFIADAKASGFVAELIDRHGVTGRLQVAPDSGK